MLVVGFRNSSILRANVIIEGNKIDVTLENGCNEQLQNYFTNIQQLSWSEKVNMLIENNISFSEENLNQKVAEYISKDLFDSINIDDFVFTEESLANAKKYKGNKMPIIDNLNYFVNKELPTQVVEMLDNIIKENLTEEYSNEVINQMNNVVMYVGPNEKYKGCIGMIGQRRNDSASELVEFPGKFNPSGTLCMYWVDPANLIYLRNI